MAWEGVRNVKRSTGYPIRVRLLAQHAELRRNMALLLSQEGMVVCDDGAPRTSGRDAPSAPADVAIVVLSGGTGHGLSLFHQLAPIPPGLPFIIVSPDEDPRSMCRAFEAGAKAFVTNRATAESLAHAVREVVAGRTYTSAPRLPG